MCVLTLYPIPNANLSPYRNPATPFTNTHQPLPSTTLTLTLTPFTNTHPYPTLNYPRNE